MIGRSDGYGPTTGRMLTPQQQQDLLKVICPVFSSASAASAPSSAPPAAAFVSPARSGPQSNGSPTPTVMSICLLALCDLHFLDRGSRHYILDLFRSIGQAQAQGVE